MWVFDLFWAKRQHDQKCALVSLIWNMDSQGRTEASLRPIVSHNRQLKARSSRIAMRLERKMWMQEVLNCVGKIARTWLLNYGKDNEEVEKSRKFPGFQVTWRKVPLHLKKKKHRKRNCLGKKGSSFAADKLEISSTVRWRYHSSLRNARLE